MQDKHNELLHAAGAEEYTVLFAKLDDLCRRAERGELCASAFLNPREQAFARMHLTRSGTLPRILFWGGYRTALRRMAVFLPDYLTDIADDDEASGDHERALEHVAGSMLEDFSGALSVRGSGYQALTHRDYMGSILGLGVDRGVIGDIAVVDDYSAVIVAAKKIMPFLLDSIDRIGRDKVRVAPYALSPDAEFVRPSEPIHDTVAAPRLDCVAAALLRCSREEAQRLVLTGLVEVNYLPCVKTSAPVSPGDTLSVRGYGKFGIDAIGPETRRGRLRLSAHKYL